MKESFPLHLNLKRKTPFQVCKFPYRIEFDQFPNALVRTKQPEDDDQEEIEKEIKKVAKTDGHIGTQDKKYFSSQKNDSHKQEEWILDLNSGNKPPFISGQTQSDRNTSYYIFAMITNECHAFPVESLWTNFKPFIRSTISHEKGEEIIKKTKEIQESLLANLNQGDVEPIHSLKSEKDDNDIFEKSEDELDTYEDEDHEYKQLVRNSTRQSSLGETGKRLSKLLNCESEDSEKESETPERKRKSENPAKVPEKKQKQDSDQEATKIIDKFLENKPTVKDLEARIKKMTKDDNNTRMKIIAHLKNTTKIILNDRMEKIIIKK